MNRTLDTVAAEAGVTVEELSVWIERRWVVPTNFGLDVNFDDADRARIRMIVDFHRDLAIDDEAMPVVLDLIDRLHAVHRQFRTVLGAIAELPEAQRAAILQRLIGEST